MLRVLLVLGLGRTRAPLVLSRSLVGAGSVVTRDVPAHALAYGNPAAVRGTATTTAGGQP